MSDQKKLIEEYHELIRDIDKNGSDPQKEKRRQQLKDRIEKNTRYLLSKAPVVRAAPKPKQEKKSGRLDEAKVRELRKTFAGGGVTLAELANKYDVGVQAIDDAIQKRTWKHVA